MFQVCSRPLTHLVRRPPIFRGMHGKVRPKYIMELKENISHLFQRPAEGNADPDTDNNCLNVVFFTNKHNSLSQRLSLELRRRRHNVKVFEVKNSEEMSEIAKSCEADLILDPFLTKRVLYDVYTANVPCIIVHPGIEGDRGAHSLDWALRRRESEWGVTLMQAEQEMDSGYIWSTSNFQVSRADVNTLTKSSLYTNEVTDAAVRCTLETIERFQRKCSPRPLNYNNPSVKGKLWPRLKKADRTVDWEGSAEEVAAQVRMSDSSPGAFATLLVRDFENSKKLVVNCRVFGAHLEGSYTGSQGDPGEIIGKKDGAILVQCGGGGAVWLSHLKKNKLKLPASSFLKNQGIFVPTLTTPFVQLPYGVYPSTFQEIWTWLAGGVCYVHFNFYNGAMNIDQCQRLSAVLRTVSKSDFCKVVVLMGGHNFFSNGIHLNCIENSHNPATASLHNLTAINDVIRDIFSMQDKLTISAVQGNAGAGGVMMALASDLVLSRDSVVLNPHYTNMSLFGSEYHTFFLPERLRKDRAFEMTSGADSILSSEAVSIGLFDGILGTNVTSFQNKIQGIARQIANHPCLSDILRQKATYRDMAWHEKVEKCRQFEIENMMRDFQSKEFEQARKSFVLH